ncbi:DNA methylase [Vibrio phage 1.060.A._10N.261.48.B5]|nr:DNA methylase [Vibrio phage 1.060.A._10N.261.48.B5]
MKGDCLERMKDIESGSVDMILTDPPYGTTACKWDSIIPLEPMWEQLKRIIKPNGAIVMFGAEPFSSLLRCSNLSQFKYDWVWQKDKATNHLNAKRMPMRRNEMISVFYEKQCLYNPQLTRKDPKNIRPPTTKRKQADNYGKMTNESVRQIPADMSYPNETLQFRGCFGDKGKSLHPTQKPVALMEYLIKTYTNEGDTVLDFTMGSGTTGVAAKNLNRSFIGIEMDDNYFEIAKERIERE